MTYYPAIDGLRAIAVLSVLLYHAGFTSAFGGGYVGVDIFFVISGYLISSIIYRQRLAGTFSFKDFYTRRLRRIMPPLFVCLLITTVAASRILIQEFQSFCGALGAAVLMVANIWFCFNSGYFDAPAKNIPLLHTWSLGVEEQFYLVFPLLMLLCMRKKRWIYPLLSLCLGASFVANIYYTYNIQTFAFYSLHSRAWELLVGSLLAVHGPFTLSIRQCRMCIYGGLGIIALTVVGYGHIYVLFPGLAAVPPVAGALLCIVGTISSSDKVVCTPLHWKPVVFIGLISYSLYLWHWPILVLYKHATESFTGLPPKTALMLLALIFILAWLSWRYVETPIRSRAFCASNTSLYYFCGIFASVLMMVAWLGYKGYLEWRLPDKAQMYSHQSQARSQLLEKIPVQNPFLQKDRLFFFGDADQEPTVLLLGDSHADALGETFDSLATQYKTRGILISVPSPLFGIHNMIDEGDPQQYQSEIKDIILHHPTLRKAVIVMRWGYYTDGCKPHEQENFLANDFGMKMPQEPAKSASKDALGTLEYGLRHTIDELRKAGMEVWVMHGVPEQDTNIPRRAARLSMEGLEVASHLRLPLDEHRYRNQKADAILQRVVPDEAYRIDPTPLLCSDELFCQAAKGDTLLYYDDDHLSVAGAKLLCPLLKKVFTTP